MSNTNMSFANSASSRILRLRDPLSIPTSLVVTVVATSMCSFVMGTARFQLMPAIVSVRHVCHASKKYHFPLLVNSARHGRAICWSHAFERHPYPLSFNVVKPIFLALAELECPHVRELLTVRRFGGHANLREASVHKKCVAVHSNT